MDLPTYTNIWRIEKRLYKLYDFRLPMPLPVGQIAVFLAIAVPYIVVLTLVGLPFNHTLVWVYVLPPGLLAWLTTRPVLEGKRLPELVRSQVRYLFEPRTWCRMAALAEKDEVIVLVRVWRQAVPATELVLDAADADVAADVAVAADADVAGGTAGRSRSTRSRRRATWPLGLPTRPLPVQAASEQAAREQVARAGHLVAQAGQPHPSGVQVTSSGHPGGRHSAPRPHVLRQFPTTSGLRPAAGLRPSSSLRLPGLARPDAAAPRPGAPAATRRTSSAGPASGAAPAGGPPTFIAGEVEPPKSRRAPAPTRAFPVSTPLPADPASGPPASEPVASRRSRSTARYVPPDVVVPPVPEPVLPIAAGAWQLFDRNPAAGGAAPATRAAEPASDLAAPPQASQPLGRDGDSEPPSVAPSPAPPPAEPVEAAEPPHSTEPARSAEPPHSTDPPHPPHPPHPAQAPPSARPTVTVTGDRGSERPLRVVERALRSQPGQRPDGWRDRVVVVPGGHRPGQPDQLQRDRARARLPVEGSRRIVVLGCTRGAGQTMTALLAGDTLASLRAEPVAVLDLNPGRGSLTERAATMPGLVPDQSAAGWSPAGAARSASATTPGGWRPDAGLQVISGGTAAEDRENAGRVLDLVAARFPLTLADPAAGCVPRTLAVADQLVIVAPASAAAASALAMTFEWLEAHGYGRLASAAVTVLNGVSGPTRVHVDHAAAVASGRCRAIVKVPWDDHLRNISRAPTQSFSAAPTGPTEASISAGQPAPPILAAPTDPRSASPLSPALTQAYTALAGVLIAGLADPGELRSARG